MIEGGGGNNNNNNDGDKDESLMSKLNPFKAVKKAQENAAIAKRKKDANLAISDDMRKQMFGEGLMGKVAAGLINNVAGALKDAMSEAAVGRCTLNAVDPKSAWFRAISSYRVISCLQSLPFKFNLHRYAAEQSQDCYDAATRAVANDARVRQYMGDGVQCTPPMSQMSSSMSVNGGAVHVDSP
jgi:hypothetical protein